jgi:hypothetical protein
MRSWLFAAFRDLKREPDGPTVALSAQAQPGRGARIRHRSS